MDEAEQTLPVVLLVDDCVHDRVVVRRLIGRQYKIVEAETGKDALAFFENNFPDCLIVDFRLPDMDGLEILRSVLAHDELRILPVVMLTGEGNEKIATQAMKDGAMDYLRKDEISKESLQNAVEAAMNRANVLRQKESQRQEWERLATVDSTTGLYNRQFLVRRLQEEVDRAVRYDTPLSVFMVDIDFFKRVNDEYGHLVGDQVLANAGKVINFCLRRTDTACRYGGEEFCVILPQTDANRAVLLAERLRRNFELSETYSHPHKLQITCSIGVASVDENCTSSSALLKLADDRLYQAKRNGRNQVCSTSEVPAAVVTPDAATVPPDTAAK